MISFLEKPHTKEAVERLLHPLVRQWFFSKFKEFSLPQLYGVKEVHERSNLMVVAPTGGTKTLTAHLAILNELVRLADIGKLEERVYAVYISPLKALNADVFVNLQQPLAEIQALAQQHHKTFDIRVGLRTGDTTAYEKQKMLKKSPHILITTPESLALILSSTKFRELLRNIDWCIVDELHALCENKRGVHLSLSLERLQELAPEMTRVGLSATVEPLQDVAKFLVGNRDCRIANVQFLKKYDLQVLSPLPDLIDTTHYKLHHALYTLLDNLIQEHKTTLIFTNTRAGTERVVHHLKEKFPSKYVENIGAHHGSLSKKHRLDIEQRLREGKLKVCATSTSLELGIDIGYIDLVICLGSPKSVARFAQRAGRSGHRLHETVKGKLIPMDRDDLIECSVLLKHALEKKIDTLHIPENCLDVLAQQIYGMAIADRWQMKDLFKVIRRSYCYRTLSEQDFLEVVKYLAGEYASLEDRHIYAKIWYDEKTHEIGRRGKMGRVIYMTNIGTIPDQTRIIVKIQEHIVGFLDEPFLERLKRGDIFVLGGNTYEFLFARGMVAQVRAAEGKSPTVPSWFSEQLPLSFDLAMAIQKFRRLMEDQFLNKKTKDEMLQFLHDYLYVDKNAAEAIYYYFKEQQMFAQIPHDKKLLVEFYQDEQQGKKFVVFHTLYGRRVNDVLSRAIGFAISRLQHRDVELGITDNGFYVASEKPTQVLRALEALQKEDLWSVMKLALEKTEVLRRRFRHCAGRALMILRMYKGEEKRVGRQQVSSMILLNAVRRISDEFSILKEARREVLEDLMDIEHAAEVLALIKEGKIEIKQFHTPLPSPFAFNLVTQGYTDILKMEDKVEFIRRMHQQVLAKIWQ
ncbi:ATP-dependent helicase [Candidatus Woesearchaeota archaeon]|nr:ATP-dependent helicase [Candidatus Woesearchaeota archaeon]